MAPRKSTIAVAMTLETLYARKRFRRQQWPPKTFPKAVAMAPRESPTAVAVAKSIARAIYFCLQLPPRAVAVALGEYKRR